jgi:uncharacterized protein (TIGR02646 family)
VYEAIPELRESLLKEQGYICAYCMRRIPTNDPRATETSKTETSKIEHIKPRSSPHRHLEMDYGNMVICCPGKMNGEDHCDTKKGDSEMRFSPFDSRTQESISYSSGNGMIKSNHTEWNEDINTVLNLNHPLLQANRKQTLDGVIDSLTILRQKGTWKSSDIEKNIAKWSNPDAEGKRKEYCGIVLWYLKRKLKRDM